MLLPIRAKNPPETFPWATCVLIVLNTIIFFLTSNGFEIHQQIADDFGLSGNNAGPINWITCSFLHGDIFHLLGNMWFLYLFGFAVEGRLRTAKFLLVYLVADLVGSLLHFVLVATAAPEIPTIGASGAIMGLLGASLWMFPFAHMDIFYWFGWFWRGIWTAPMWGVGAYYLGMDLLMASMAMESGVANFAHLGGALGGFLAVLILGTRRDSAEASEAKATLAEMKDLGMLSAWELADLHRANPTEPLIVLHWMNRCQRDGRVPDECHRAFRALLPAMVRDVEPVSVGFAVAAQFPAPGQIDPSLLLDLGLRCERAGEFLLAIRLLEYAVATPGVRADIAESALYRVGVLCETATANPQRALHAYDEMVRRYGISPLADQARERARQLRQRLGA